MIAKRKNNLKRALSNWFQILNSCKQDYYMEQSNIISPQKN